MNPKKFSVLSWNFRGLGSLEKCLVVRNVIKSRRCDVVCLQETKWNSYNLHYFLAVFPSYFDHQGAYICANNSSGGCVITWKRNYKLLSSWSTAHTITVVLQQYNSGVIFAITNVYRPSSNDHQKKDFLFELHRLSSLINYPWILAGNFKTGKDREGED